MKKTNRRTNSKRQTGRGSVAVSGITLMCVWLFLLAALVSRTDLITLGQFYLYHAKDRISRPISPLPEGKEAYDVLMEDGILPADPIKRFFEAGGKVIVTDKTEKADSLQALTDHGYTIQGKYQKGADTITIKKGSTAITYAHELGHFSDAAYGPLSSTEDFHDLADKYGAKYAAYKKATFDTGIAVYWENGMYNEMFAEMFADTCLYPRTMQRIFPEVYEYMKNLAHEKI